MVDVDPGHFPDTAVDRFAERPTPQHVDTDERARLGSRWTVAIATVTAVLVGVGVVAVVGSLSSTDDEATDTSASVALRRLLFSVAPAGTALVDAAETSGAATKARRSVAVVAGPDGAVAVVTAQLDDGTRWPPAGAEPATIALADDEPAYLDPDLVWRRGGVRYRVQHTAERAERAERPERPDDAALVALADGVRPTADATRSLPAAFTVTPPPGWRVRYTGGDLEDAPTATALYRGDGRTMQVTTWAMADAVELATARATGARTVSLRNVDATLWRDEDGPLVSSATAHLVWQEPDGLLVHVRSTGITDDELIASTGLLTTAAEASWRDALAVRTPVTTT